MDRRLTRIDSNEMLWKRASIIRQVRSFFYNKNYLELDTPLLSGDLIPESCLEVFRTQRLFPQGSRQKSYPLWLIPSPEIWMKKIISRNRTNIFQICKCFRNGESTGFLHNFEFTMLEYYTMDADYIDSLKLTEELFKYLFEKEDMGITRICADRGTEDAFLFERITVAQAFERFAGFDLFAAAAMGEGAMEKEAIRLGIEPMPGLTTAQLYDIIFIHSVEPRLKSEKPVALIDYPAFVPCLAKNSADGKTCERWELYLNGIELANCFSEETNPQKVKEYFINEEEKKTRDALVTHRVDRNFFEMFETSRGFPRCSGVAMGLDRLIMALTGQSTIDSVLPFEKMPNINQE